MGAQELKQFEPVAAEQLLRDQGFEDQADALGIVANMAAHDRHPLGHAVRLEYAGRLALYGNWEESIRDKSMELYLDVRTLHERTLVEASQLVNGLLARSKPGLLHIASTRTPKGREPLVRLEYVEAVKRALKPGTESDPHAARQAQVAREEARLRILGRFGPVEETDLPDLDLQCNIGKLPKIIKARLIPLLKADTAETAPDSLLE